MANLQDIINLAKADGGKFFVMDESGDAQLVIMSVEDYEELLIGKLARQVEDVEDINKIITQAQLQEDLTPEVVTPVIKGPTVSTRPRHEQRQSFDLRAEVIDPSFDFEGPKMEIDDL